VTVTERKRAFDNGYRYRNIGHPADKWISMKIKSVSYCLGDTLVLPAISISGARPANTVLRSFFTAFFLKLKKENCLKNF